jgi:hypothetical protein
LTSRAGIAGPDEVDAVLEEEDDDDAGEGDADVPRPREPVLTCAGKRVLAMRAPCAARDPLLARATTIPRVADEKERALRANDGEVGVHDGAALRRIDEVDGMITRRRGGAAGSGRPHVRRMRAIVRL